MSNIRPIHPSGKLSLRLEAKGEALKTETCAPRPTQPRTAGWDQIPAWQ